MTISKSSSSIRNKEQDIVFKNALTTYSEDFADRWGKIAAYVPGKTL